MTYAELARTLRVPICIGLVAGLWQLVYLMGMVPDKYLPSITRGGLAAWEMAFDGDILRNELHTFARALSGLTVAGLLGIALAIISDLSPMLARGLRHMSDVLQPVPPAAFVPLAVFSLGLGYKLFAFVIILVTIWPPYLNGIAALSAVSPVQLNTGRMFGCSRWDLLWRIKLPAAMPEIFTGIRYASTIALIVVIVVIMTEMLAGSDGIGNMIFVKAFAMRTPEVLVLMFVVGLNGVVMNGLVNLLRKAVTGWNIRMMVRPE